MSLVERRVTAAAERQSTGAEVTRDGRPVATLSPLPRTPLSAEELLSRARALPAIDGDRFRADVDRLIDQQW